MFKGVATALITPFDENGVDFDAYEKLINYQIANGADALVVCGTTGEPATMTETEKKSVIGTALEVIAHRVPAIVGSGSNATHTAISASREAEALGADALLVVTPYYNKCTQGGLIEHYTSVAESVKLPIIMYNVPGRTGVNIKPETALALSKVGNIKAIKEASGNIAQVMELSRLLAGTGVSIYSGDDALTLPMLALGIDGVISVTSNIVPRVMHDIVTLFHNGKVDEARALHMKYLKLMNVLFVETNPIPVKYAACKTGIIPKNILRLPLTPIEEQDAQRIDAVMRELGLID